MRCGAFVRVLVGLALFAAAAPSPRAFAGDRDLWDPLTGKPEPMPSRPARAIASPASASPTPSPSTFDPSGAQDNSEMVRIPAGSFLMGSNDQWNDERPVHKVWIDEFLLDKFEVTNRRYAIFLTASRRAAPTYWEDERFNRPEQPVIGVSWEDAAAFCKWAGKRLPSEAEWERAARGGLEGKTYPWGDGDPVGRAWFGQTGDNAGPLRVGQLPPNGFGLHDMAGNVCEWCQDWGDENYYAHSEPKNPRGPRTGTERIARGGSWGPGEKFLRCALRYRFDPKSRHAYVGFRCALSP